MSQEQQAHAIEVGRRIAFAREQKRYTQASLANKVGLTSSAIAQYETGRNFPKPVNANRIAKECGVSVEWLWRGDQGADTAEAQTTAERDALAVIRDIPIEWQEFALEQMKAIRDRLTKKD